MADELSEEAKRKIREAGQDYKESTADAIRADTQQTIQKMQRDTEAKDKIEKEHAAWNKTTVEYQTEQNKAALEAERARQMIEAHRKSAPGEIQARTAEISMAQEKTQEEQERWKQRVRTAVDIPLEKGKQVASPVTGTVALAKEQVGNVVGGIQKWNEQRKEAAQQKEFKKYGVSSPTALREAKSAEEIQKTKMETHKYNIELKKLEGRHKQTQAEALTALKRQRELNMRLAAQRGDITVAKAQYDFEQQKEKALEPNLGPLGAPSQNSLLGSPVMGQGIIGGSPSGGLGGTYFHVSPPTTQPTQPTAPSQTPSSGPISAPQGPAEDPWAKLGMGRNRMEQPQTLDRLQSPNRSNALDTLTRPSQGGFEHLTHPSGQGQGFSNLTAKGSGFASLASPTGINIQKSNFGGGLDNLMLRGPAKFQNTFGEGWKKLSLKRR